MKQLHVVEVKVDVLAPGLKPHDVPHLKQTDSIQGPALARLEAS